MTTVIGSVSATTMPPAGDVKNYTSNLLNYNFVFIHVIYLLITNIRAGTSVGVTTNAMPTTSGTKYVLKQFFCEFIYNLCNRGNDCTDDNANHGGFN